MFTELTVGNNTYKLRLTTKGSIALEKNLGYNPISMLMSIERGVMPKLTDVLIIFHQMLQPYNHGLTLDKTYDIFDEYVEDGHNMFDLIPVFIEVFQDSGYISKDTDEETPVDEKN